MLEFNRKILNTIIVTIIITVVAGGSNMAYKGVTQFGFRARTALYLIFNKGKWKTIYDIAEGTNLALSSVISACRYLTTHFPNMFETDGRRYRFKGFRNRGD